MASNNKDTVAILQLAAQLKDNTEKELTQKLKSTLTIVEKEAGKIQPDVTVDEKSVKKEVKRLIVDLQRMIKSGASTMDMSKQLMNIVDIFERAEKESKGFISVLSNISVEMGKLDEIAKHSEAYPYIMIGIYKRQRSIYKLLKTLKRPKAIS